MKKVILGLALFATSFALANEPVKNGEADLKAESQQPTTIQVEGVAADCGCEVEESTDGTCTQYTLCTQMVLQPSMGHIQGTH